MEKLFKQDKRVFLLLACLVSISFLIAIFGESIAQSWRLANYKHPSEVEGVRIGDLEKDVVFFNGNSASSARAVFKANAEGVVDYINFEVVDFSSYSYPNGTMPIKTVQDLLHKFGEPQIYIALSDGSERRYTYSDDELRTGVSYWFSKNQLIDVAFGEIEWRGMDGPVGDYEVNGIRYCPGDRCPLLRKAGILAGKTKP